MVKNFYMDTKKGTLEQSVLDVWKDGAEVKEGASDGRTKEYKEHRKKLESVRQYRANAAKAVNKEAWEIGTKEYRKYLERITPGSVSEENLDEAKISVANFISGLERKKFDDTMKKMRLNFQAVDLDSYEADTSTIRAIAKLAKKMGYDYWIHEEAEIDEAKGSTKYVVMQGPGDNNQKVIATFDGGPKALEKAKKFRDDWNKKNKSKIKLNKKGKPIAAHMARIFDKGVETSYKVGDKVSYSAFAPSIIKDEKDSEELDTEPGKTSKKMKRAKEPAVNIATEALSKKQKKLDVDGDGEIEGSDLAKLRKKAKKEGKSELEVAKEFKVHSMKKALAQVWGFEEHKGNKPHKHPHEENEKTDTGKKVAKVDVDPDLKEKKKKISAGKAY